MSKLSVVMKDGQETEWNIQHDETFRTFTVNELKVPSAVFFSDKGILLPQDGNIECLVEAGSRVFMGFLPTPDKKLQDKKYYVEMNDVPFLHAPENEAVLGWISKCCAGSGNDDAGMMISLPENDVQVKFEGGGVTVTGENGTTEQLHIMKWISSLPRVVVKAKCNTRGVDHRHIHVCSPQLRARIPRPPMYVIDDCTELEEQCRSSSPPLSKRLKQDVKQDVKQDKATTSNHSGFANGLSEVSS